MLNKIEIAGIQFFLHIPIREGIQRAYPLPVHYIMMSYSANELQNVESWDREIEIKKD
jgi:hypothetical protein